MNLTHLAAGVIVIYAVLALDFFSRREHLPRRLALWSAEKIGTVACVIHCWGKNR